MCNYISGIFKLFPSSKIDFWPFLKWQKMENVKDKCDIQPTREYFIFSKD